MKFRKCLYEPHFANSFVGDAVISGDRKNKGFGTALLF